MDIKSKNWHNLLQLQVTFWTVGLCVYYSETENNCDWIWLTNSKLESSLLLFEPKLSELHLSLKGFFSFAGQNLRAHETLLTCGKTSKPFLFKCKTFKTITGPEDNESISKREVDLFSRTKSGCSNLIVSERLTLLGKGGLAYAWASTQTHTHCVTHGRQDFISDLFYPIQQCWRCWHLHTIERKLNIFDQV